MIGKSASAGAIQILTKRPTDEVTGFVSGQLGENGRRRFEGAIGGPLVEKLVQFRIAALGDTEQGFIRNTFDDIDPSAPSAGATRTSTAHG